MKTDQELKQLAMDVCDNKVFTDHQCGSPEEVGMVFMPLALGAFADSSKEEIKNIGMIYEYLSEAGPRSVNGKPCFTSFTYISKDEYKTFIEHFKRYEKLKKEFIGGVINENQ